MGRLPCLPLKFAASTIHPFISVAKPIHASLASIFSLLEAYPLSPVLLQYLCVALDSESPNPVLPIGIYITALIAWSQTILASPTDQTTQLLSALCAIAAPRVQKPSVNLTPTLPTAQGCVSLVQHVSHMHDALLTSSALDILLAVLQTVVASPRNPNLSPALALNLVPGINDLLDGGEIVSPPLTNWLFQLSALTTVDGPGPSRVPQQVTDESPQRPELLEFSRNGPLFDVLAYQVTTVLAYPDSHLSALQTVYNTTHAPDSFFPQLYLALISILANEPDGNTRLIIRAALFGSLPGLLCQLDAVQTKLKEGVQLAIIGLFTHYGALLDKCDAAAPITRAREDSMEEDVPEDGSKGKNIRTTLVQSLQSVSLLDSNLPSPPGIVIENWPGRGVGRVFTEAGENGQELEVYLRSKLLSLDVPVSDKLELIDRAVVDPETHAYIVGLRVPPTEFVAAGLAFLEDWEGAGVGDPQSALGQYGDVLLLLQLLVTRYELRSGTLKHGDRVLDASYLTSSWAVYNLLDLTEPERTLINDWVKAAFDSNSFGIDDNILRSTSPRVLLKLSATLFTEAIRKCAAEPEGAGMEILRNGVQYFEGPLLNWTLRGVIWALSNEAERHGHAAQTHLDILQLLILANGCPAPVIEMTRHRVLRLLASPYIPKANIDVNAMLRVLHPSSTGSDSTGTSAPLFASSYLNLALQASIGGTPIPNPARILPFTSPLELLRAPVQQGSDSVAHRNIVIALLTLARPRFAGIKSVLSALRSLVGTIDADFLAGVVAGSVSVWVAAPSERALAREKVKRFVSEGEKEKGLDGIVKRMMGVEAVTACVARDSIVSTATSNVAEASTAPEPKPEPVTLPIHPEFAYEDGNIELQTFDHTFWVHEFLLKKFSVFAERIKEAREKRKMVNADRLVIKADRRSESVVAALRVLYAPVFPGPEAHKFNSETLIKALRIATFYGCPDMRKYTISELEKRFTFLPIYRIQLSDEFNLPTWEKPAFLELCRRPEPISKDEAKILGLDRLAEISRIREAEQRRKFVELVEKSVESNGLLAQKGLPMDERLRADAKYTLKYSALPECDCRIQRVCDDTQSDRDRVVGPMAMVLNNRHSTGCVVDPRQRAMQPNSSRGLELSVVPCQIHKVAPRVMSESHTLFKQRNDLVKRFGDLKVAVSNQIPRGDRKDFSVEDEINRATWVRKAT
ncbi:unnamed protein product [Rhizoctonia solani]|uniref:Mediator of RNA polymerase II transcription subunit 5 n=1 Tax=Rhizoctonia solani TaxID=456999 RepID=A0A8H3D0D9_9AGAM|nr:unnamed protein product [Rhizoctonia solani]